MKIAVLTSSRADYSIYYPLLKALRNEPGFVLHIIAFGTHFSTEHGHTVDKIIGDGFNVTHKIRTLFTGDAPNDIASAMGSTMNDFARVWIAENYDLVFCLGDRYEMFAAVASAMPFNIKLAHIHGGETTLGAIDNAFRHSITVMSKLHFTTTETYKARVIEIMGSDANVYNVGALSIDNLEHLQLMSKEEFKKKFFIDLDIPSVLITFHPETVSFEKNREYVAELVAALSEIKDHQLIITMPNADTMGNYVRERLKSFISEHSNTIGIESFGTIGYLSAMKHCSFMLGNTSSGFVEANYFPKYVINLGDRQKGRLVTSNIINCEIKKQHILDAVARVRAAGPAVSERAYGDGTAAKKIIHILKQERERL